MTFIDEQTRAAARERSKARRARAKQGLREVAFFVPEEEARKFVTDIGWCTKSRAMNFQEVGIVLGKVLNGLITKHAGRVTRDDEFLTTESIRDTEHEKFGDGQK